LSRSKKHAILAWFKERGASWQQEIEGVLDFYIYSVEHPASVPDAFEPGEMDRDKGIHADDFAMEGLSIFLFQQRGGRAAARTR